MAMPSLYGPILSPAVCLKGAKISTSMRCQAKIRRQRTVYKGVRELFGLFMLEYLSGLLPARTVVEPEVVVQMKRFSGKVALVTGSSNGIGCATALLLARDGASVVITGRDESALREALAEALSSGVQAENVLLVRGDVTDDAFRKHLVEQTLRVFGRIDVLINNAGALDKDNSGKGPGFEGQDEESFDYIMGLNIRSIISLLYACLPHLVKAKGDVINISSVGGLHAAMPNFPFYSASKAALSQLTRSLAYEYIQKGVRFNTVSPGLVATRILQKQGVPEEISKKMEHGIEKNPLNIPSGYVGTSDDIANVIAFLADRPTSRYIVGANLIVDGGSHIVMPLVTGNFHEYM